MEAAENVDRHVHRGGAERLRLEAQLQAAHVVGAGALPHPLLRRRVLLLPIPVEGQPCVISTVMPIKFAECLIEDPKSAG